MTNNDPCLTSTPSIHCILARGSSDQILWKLDILKQIDLWLTQVDPLTLWSGGISADWPLDDLWPLMESYIIPFSLTDPTLLPWQDFSAIPWNLSQCVGGYTHTLHCFSSKDRYSDKTSRLITYNPRKMSWNIQASLGENATPHLPRSIVETCKCFQHISKVSQN